MKKLVTLSLCVAVLTATAQTVIKEMDGADTRFIPGQYMKNGEAAIYFSGDEYGYDDLGYQAKIFDFELNPLKTFDFPILQPYVVFTRKATNGAQVFSMPIAPDATQVLVPTANLTSGMYMFSVIENGRATETCKIIVR